MPELERRPYRFYTNRIGIPPTHVEMPEGDDPLAEAEALVREMVLNGPTDGDAGFWLEPQARRLWDIIQSLCNTDRNGGDGDDRLP